MSSAEARVRARGLCQTVKGKGVRSRYPPILSITGDPHLRFSSYGLERIPKPSYAVLKDKKIREMLAEYDLPTTGTREQMVARHTQYVTKYLIEKSMG